MVAGVTLAKILGVVAVIPLTALIHAEGLGIYSNAYTLYINILTFATAGFPTAMGKLVSERLALNKYSDVERIYQVTMKLLLVLSVLTFLLMWFGAPAYSYLVAMKDPDTASRTLVWSIRALSFCLLLVPLESGLRGYFQGFQKLEVSAYSQALEQLVRVVALILGAYIVMRLTHNVAMGAAGATFAAAPGALAGVILLAVYAVPLRRKFLARLSVQDKAKNIPTKQMVGTLFRIAFPVSLGASVVPIAGLVDSLTVTNFLTFSGFSLKEALAQYGILTRQAFTLIQLPLAFAMAVGASVLPAIAQARTLRDRNTIERNISGTIRSMFFMTFPVAGALLVLGRPIDFILFHTYAGAAIISSVSFMSVFSSLELISTYMLQGLDKMYRPVRNMFIGVIIKLLLNIALIMPFHIMGAALATTIGYLFSASLNVMAVKKYGKVSFSVWRLAAPYIFSTAIICLIMAGFSWLGFAVAAPLAGTARYPVALLQVFLALASGAIVYLVVTLRIGVVSATELERLPAVGVRLARLSRRLRPEPTRSY